MGEGTTVTLLTTSEAATFLRYKTPAAVRQLKRRGKIAPIGRRGKVDLYDRAALIAFVMVGSQTERAEHAQADQKGAYSDGELDGRMEDDQVAGHMDVRESNPHQSPYDLPEDRKAPRSKPRVQRPIPTRSASEAKRNGGRAPGGKRGDSREASISLIRSLVDAPKGCDR